MVAGTLLFLLLAGSKHSYTVDNNLWKCRIGDMGEAARGTSAERTRREDPGVIAERTRRENGEPVLLSWGSEFFSQTTLRAAPRMFPTTKKSGIFFFG